jgi:hypothetical protein
MSTFFSIYLVVAFIVLALSFCVCVHVCEKCPRVLTFCVRYVERRARFCSCSLAGIAGSNPGGDMDICRMCCVLWGRVLSDGLIPRPEESYRV